MSTTPDSTPDQIDLSKVEVLLVEDDFHTREMVRQVLKQIGVGAIHSAENGLEAITLLRAGNGRIDMTFLDLDMPVMGGFNCLKAIRAAPMPFIAELPVIILTAYAGFPQLEKAAGLGISAFLSKPVSIKTLSDAVHKALTKETINPRSLVGIP